MSNKLKLRLRFIYLVRPDEVLLFMKPVIYKDDLYQERFWK